MRHTKRPGPLLAIIGTPLLMATTLLSGCVTSSVDEMVYARHDVSLKGDARVVILGRRHAPDYETEPDFIQCVGRHVSNRARTVGVIPELDFINSLYPWFEPRTAPMHPQDVARLLTQAPVASRLQELDVDYIVWIDGNTTRTEGSGSMTCAIGPGGGGCFGFGSWANDSNYEAVIWDLTGSSEVGRISTSASGTSYMPAVFVPIPIIAPVRGTACDGLGDQLVQFLSSN